MSSGPQVYTKKAWRQWGDLHKEPSLGCGRQEEGEKPKQAPAHLQGREGWCWDQMSTASATNWSPSADFWVGRKYWYKTWLSEKKSHQEFGQTRQSIWIFFSENPINVIDRINCHHLTVCSGLQTVADNFVFFSRISHAVNCYTWNENHNHQIIIHLIKTNLSISHYIYGMVFMCQKSRYRVLWSLYWRQFFPSVNIYILGQ